MTRTSPRCHRLRNQIPRVHPAAPCWPAHLPLPQELCSPAQRSTPSRSAWRRRAKAGEVDPIFAVIAEHREAQEACAVAYEANDLDDDEDPNKLAALEKAGAVELPLFTTLPTSVAGVVALLEYVHSPCHIIWQGEQRGCDDTVLSYAYGYNSEEMRQAVGGFDAHVLTALRNITRGGQA
jgi:hypothetical protein